jgi:hypothetical protein
VDDSVAVSDFDGGGVYGIGFGGSGWSGGNPLGDGKVT